MEIGLALAGGGVKGAAHIGAIKALEENNIKIGYIGGTSIGSIVASLYAMGYTTEEMLKLFKYFAKDVMKIDPKYFWVNVKARKNFIGEGLISGDNLETAIQECANLKNIKNINQIKMPIVIPAVDIRESKKYVFTNQTYSQVFNQDQYINDVEVGKAVRSSASYPGMFAPCKIGNHKFVDGGVIDNLPAQEVRKLGAKKVLSIRFGSNKNTEPNGLIEIATKSIDILFDQRTAAEIESSDYAITLPLEEASVFNIKKIDYCYNEGYIKTIENMHNIKKIIEK